MAPSKAHGKKPRTSIHYTEEQLEAAVQSVRAGKSKAEAARLHKVPRTTLIDRLAGRLHKSQLKKTFLSTNEEGLLADWIQRSARLGFDRTKSQIVAYVQSMVKSDGRDTPFKDGKPGRKWFSLFMKRHADIITKTPKALESQRASVTKENVAQWFEDAHQDMTSVLADILNDPSRIFNCDASRFQLGGGISKVLAEKAKKRVKEITTETHQQITVLACGNASGDVLPPLFIFPGQRLNYDPLEGFPEASFARSKNGWHTSIFLKWLEKIFIPQTKDLKKPLVLFVDGHKTNVTFKVCTMCKENDIILYQLPSHFCHIVQPLDLTTFKTLKQAWREEVINFQTENSDVLDKRNFAKVFRKAWERGIKSDVVVSGFRAAGIYPWNPEHVDLAETGPSGLFSSDPNEFVLTEEGHDIVTEEEVIIPLSPPHLLENDDPPPPSFENVNVNNSSSLSTHTVMPTSSFGVDMHKLLFLVAKRDQETLTRRIATHDTGCLSNDAEDQLFYHLYGRLNELICHADGCSSSSASNPKAFENLQLPSKLKSAKNKAVIFQPSNVLTSDEVMKNKSDTINKKKQDEEKKERKKRREEEKKTAEENRKRKREEQERKKKEREEKKLALEKKRTKKSKKPGELMKEKGCSDSDNSLS